MGLILCRMFFFCFDLKTINHEHSIFEVSSTNYLATFFYILFRLLSSFFKKTRAGHDTMKKKLSHKVIALVTHKWQKKYRQELNLIVELSKLI